MFSLGRIRNKSGLIMELMVFIVRACKRMMFSAQSQRPLLLCASETTQQELLTLTKLVWLQPSYHFVYLCEDVTNASADLALI